MVSQALTKQTNLQQLVPIAVVWLMLLSFGVVMVASASVVMSDNYLQKHLFYLALASLSFVVGGVWLWLPTDTSANCIWAR